jgi:urease accessory protein UreE
VILVETVLPSADDAGREVDTLRLTWEARRKTRQKLTTTGGRSVGLALATGTTLLPGDVLHRAPALVIVVEGVPERVFVLSPSSTREACACCHQLGNLHRPIALDVDADNSVPQVTTPYERALQAAIERMGVAYDVQDRVFTHSGAGGAASHVH